MEKKNKQIEEGVAFPNLPYIKDGDCIVTETYAIGTYLISKANKPDMLGKDSKEQIQHQQVFGVVSDLYDVLAKVITSDDYKGVFGQEKGKLEHKLERLNSFVGDKDYLFPQLTFVDFFFPSVYSNIKKHFKSLDIDFSSYSKLDKVLENYRK